MMTKLNVKMQFKKSSFLIYKITSLESLSIINWLVLNAVYFKIPITKSSLNKLFLHFDKSCGDVSRLRIYSYDENAYFNEEAIVFEQFFEYKSEIIPKRISSSIKGNQNKGKTTHSKVMSVVTRLNNTSTDITKTYEHWFQIGCAFASEFGEEGRDIFHLVSQNHPKYHSGECDRLFTNCIEAVYSYGIGTFFYLVEQSGNV